MGKGVVVVGKGVVVMGKGVVVVGKGVVVVACSAGNTWPVCTCSRRCVACSHLVCFS